MKRNTLFLIIGLSLFLLVILGVIFYFISPQRNYRVLSVNIQPGKLISIYQPIVITLNYPVSDGMQKNCTILTNPTIDISLSHTSNSISMKPITHFGFASNYQLHLMCKEFTFDISFTTPAESSLSSQDMSQLQTQNDFSVAKGLQDLYVGKPWLQKLPLITPQYELAYSSVNNEFVAAINIIPGSKVTREQVAGQIHAALQAIGAPDLPIFYK